MRPLFAGFTGAGLFIRGGDGVDAGAGDSAGHLGRSANDGGACAHSRTDQAALQQDRTADDGEQGGCALQGQAHDDGPYRRWMVGGEGFEPPTPSV